MLRLKTAHFVMEFGAAVTKGDGATGVFPAAFPVSSAGVSLKGLRGFNN